MKAGFAQDFLLPLLLLAGINPPLSTALAAGGAPAIVPVLQITFTNPTPALDDYFGWSVAAVGSDRVLIGAAFDGSGAQYAGAAYLFSINGTLLTTFTNPTPAAYDYFGWSVAAVGGDRVIIGAYGDHAGAPHAGAAYLFSTNGTLLTTFTNPTPETNDFFGWSVAAVGSDKVVIGARGDNTGAIHAGAAYLFRTDGTLLTTFTNPSPASGDKFGGAVAAVGSDHVLIGAPGYSVGAASVGAAYLLNTNGTLLTTFTNPTPAAGDFFGSAVAALGSDRVLIGAYWGDAGATDAGAAYLFSTNGTLLTTFANPTPADRDQFGYVVAAVGNDRLLIGAVLDGTNASGAAYLFSTNGTLLATLTNPTPATNDDFGLSVSAVGNDRVLIGAYGVSTGAVRAGVAYLFSLVPSLDIHSTPMNTLTVSWPLFAPDFLLQQNTNGLATGNWSNVTDTIQDDGTNKYIIIDPAVGNRFYRLSKPNQ